MILKSNSILVNILIKYDIYFVNYLTFLLYICILVKFLTMKKNFNIFGVIGIDVNPIDFEAFINKCDKKNNILINIDSVGGYVDAGQELAALIEKSVKDGYDISTKAIFVASAANLCYLAAYKRIVTPQSRFLIHNSWSEVIGNSAVLDAASKSQKRIDDDMRAFYAQKSGTDAELFAKYMDNDTEFGAETALNLGFANIEESNKAMALLSALPKNQIDSDNVVLNSKSDKMSKFFNKMAALFKAEGIDLPEAEKEVAAAAVENAVNPDMQGVLDALKAINTRLDALEGKSGEMEVEMNAIPEAVLAAVNGALKVAKISAKVLPIADKGIAPIVSGRMLTSQEIVDKAKAEGKIK